MPGNFQEGFRPTDIKPPEIEGPDTQQGAEIPSVGELKSKLEDIFVFNPEDCPETQPEVLGDNPLEDENPGTIILEDGTIIDLPSPPMMYSEASESESLNCDDNGHPYRTEDGGWVPNNTYVLDEITYKTDDNGQIYMVDGKLEPNTTYELNGNIYTTDEQGRIISCEAKPERSPENPRDTDAQRDAGGEDRKLNDQGGHIVGRDLNGDGGAGNLVAMDSKINQSDYKRMENDVKTALDEGKDVTTTTEISYEGDSERPDKITVIVTADGKDTVYKFDNNLDGSLIDEVPENGKQTVQAELDDTGGQVSSIKEEYDENGNRTKTTVYITYTDEDGANRRTKVVIESTPGGEK